MESVTERNSTPATDRSSGLHGLDIVGFSPARGLSRRMGDDINRNEQKLNVDAKSPTHIMKITVNEQQRGGPVYKFPGRLLTRRSQKEDTTLLKLDGSPVLVNPPDTLGNRSKSGSMRKNSTSNISLPSISSKAGSEGGALSVSQYYDTDFGFNFERLVPGTGMSQHKDPPKDAGDLEAGLANTATKHIYSLQIVSTAHRGSKRTESVHSLLNTIWPPVRPRSYKRTRGGGGGGVGSSRNENAMKLPTTPNPTPARSRPLTRSSSHLRGGGGAGEGGWGGGMEGSRGRARVASPFKASTLIRQQQRGNKLNYPPVEMMGGLRPVKPSDAAHIPPYATRDDDASIYGSTVTPSPRK